MNINCPQCNKEYEIDEAKIPVTGAQVKCSQCETMIDIDFPVEDKPDWYITTDEENIYEATNQEVVEWIQENRLIGTHKVSKDKKNWSLLKDIPQFLKILKEKEINIEDEPTIQNKSNSEDKIVPSYKKIDYADYDDSIIESSDNYKSKKGHIFIWIILFLLMGAGIFAVIKPKLVKKIFTKINSTSNVSSEDKYNRAMTLFKSYDVQNKDKIISLFNQSLKENPKYEPAFINKTLFIAYNLFFEELNLNFRKNLSKKLEVLSKQNNNEIINKILIKNNKTLLQVKKEIESLKLLLNSDVKNKINSIKNKTHNLIITLALLSYLDGNKNALKTYNIDAKIQKNNDKTAFIKLLFLKLNNDKLYLTALDDLTIKYAQFIPLNFLNAFELLNKNKYGVSRASFKTIKALSPKNKIATDYILLLNTLIKNKELLEEKKVEDTKDLKKDDTDKTKNKEEIKSVKDTKEIKDTSKKVKTTKVIAKKTVKLSAEKATNIGWNLIDSNRLSSAIGKFKYAISVNPNYALAYQGLGEAYRLKKDNANAIKYLKIFISKDPNNSEAGLARKQIKRLEKSDK